MPILNMILPDVWWGWRQPWANTIWYWKLEENTDATVWTTTSSNNVTFTTLASWKKVAVFNGSSSRVVMSALATWTENTYSMWVKKNWSWTGEQQIGMLCWWSGKKGAAIRTNTSPRWYMNSKFTAWVNITWATANNTWYHIVIVQNSSWSTVYLNWTLAATDNQTWANSNPLSSLWANSYAAQDYFNWNISEVIAENKARTAQEVSDYYNQTKPLYWIS